LRGKDLRKFERCLAFPLSSVDAERGFEVGTWIALCNRLLPSTAESAVVFWDAVASEQARVYVFFRTPVPKYVGFLIDPAAAPDAIWDLATIGQNKKDDPKTDLPPEISLLLENKEITIDEFLSKFAM
jgi:hypothetical protein